MSAVYSEWSQGKSEQTKGCLLNFAAKHPELELGQRVKRGTERYQTRQPTLVTTEVKALDCKYAAPHEHERVLNTKKKPFSHFRNMCFWCFLTLKWNKISEHLQSYIWYIMSVRGHFSILQICFHKSIIFFHYLLFLFIFFTRDMRSCHRFSFLLVPQY